MPAELAASPRLNPYAPATPKIRAIHYGLSVVVMTKQTSESTIACDVCGWTAARVRRVPRSYGRGKDLLVIQGVPVISCTHCGESYLTTLREVERIKRERRGRARKQEVSVAEFT